MSEVSQKSLISYVWLTVKLMFSLRHLHTTSTTTTTTTTTAIIATTTCISPDKTNKARQVGSRVNTHTHRANWQQRVEIGMPSFGLVMYIKPTHFYSSCPESCLCECACVWVGVYVCLRCRLSTSYVLHPSLSLSHTQTHSQPFISTNPTNLLLPNLVVVLVVIFVSIVVMVVVVVVAIVANLRSGRCWQVAGQPLELVSNFVVVATTTAAAADPPSRCSSRTNFSSRIPVELNLATILIIAAHIPT